jgi:hypothetical protein
MKHIFLLFRQKEETSTGTNYELIGFTYHIKVPFEKVHIECLNIMDKASKNESRFPLSSYCKIYKVFHLEGFAAWNIFLEPNMKKYI